MLTRHNLGGSSDEEVKIKQDLDSNHSEDIVDEEYEKSTTPTLNRNKIIDLEDDDSSAEKAETRGQKKQTKAPAARKTAALGKEREKETRREKRVPEGPVVKERPKEKKINRDGWKDAEQERRKQRKKAIEANAQDAQKLKKEREDKQEKEKEKEKEKRRIALKEKEIQEEGEKEYERRMEAEAALKGSESDDQEVKDKDGDNEKGKMIRADEMEREAGKEKERATGKYVAEKASGRRGISSESSSDVSSDESSEENEVDGTLKSGEGSKEDMVARKYAAKWQRSMSPEAIGKPPLPSSLSISISISISIYTHTLSLSLYLSISLCISLSLSLRFSSL